MSDIDRRGEVGRETDSIPNVSAATINNFVRFDTEKFVKFAKINNNNNQQLNETSNFLF